MVASARHRFIRFSLSLSQSCGMLISLFLSPALAAGELPPAPPSAHEVDPFKELLIVDDQVVRDKRSEALGPWTAGYLFSQLLPPTATVKEKSDLVKSLFTKWNTDQTLPNGQVSAKRDSAEFIILCPWINVSFDNKDCKGDLDLSKAPFRLLGIVNRVDIGSHTADGKGEARFVYALLDSHTVEQNTIGSARQFTLIFEYDITPAPFTRKSWAQSWHHLGQLACTSAEDCEEFREYLTKLTKSFTDYNDGNDKLPHNTYLSQVRSSELQLMDPWQWREFVLKEPGDGPLSFSQTYTFQTPHNDMNGNAELGAWINENRELIKKGTYVLPEKFRGGESSNMGGRTQWRFPELDEPIRRAFAKNTCNGCHMSEEEPISRFYHIAPFENLVGRKRLSPYMFDVAIPKRRQIFEKILK